MTATDQTVQAYITANYPNSNVRILRWASDGTFNQNYVLGGDYSPGFADWITTNTADDEPTQAAAILAAMSQGQE